MTRRELTEAEREDWHRILAADTPPGYQSPFDDPDWVRRDNERWLERKRREEELRAGPTGGKPASPARADQPTERRS